MAFVKNLFGQGVVQVLIGALIGALFTLIVAEIYYRRAGRELREEAARLAHLNKLIIRALDDAGFAEVARDSSGEPIGLVIKLRGTLSGHSSISGDLGGARDQP